MAYTTLGLVRTLHVLAVALTLGTLATLPWIRPLLHEAGDSRWATAGLRFVGRVQDWLLLPSTVALLAFGLAMVEGPLATFSFTAPGAGWLHLGTTLWMLLAASVGVMWHSQRRLIERAEDGTTGGSTVAKHWRRWTMAASTGLLVTTFGVAVMAMKLGA